MFKALERHWLHKLHPSFSLIMRPHPSLLNTCPLVKIWTDNYPSPTCH